MKKLLSVVLLALLLVVVTGCGKNQVKCTASTSEGGVNVTAEVIADLDKDDKVTSATIVYDFGDKDTATTYCGFLKLAEDSEKGITVDCSGSKITIKGYEKLDAEEGEAGYTGVTKAEFVKAMEEEDFKCK